jgi:hypothetical protein
VIDNTYRLIIITPVYEDLDASSRLFEELSELYGDSVFVVAVDDGSLNQPIDEKILNLADVSGVVLKLKRNVGHQKAIAIGLSFVSEYVSQHQRIVIMDSDGEDLPSTIDILLNELDLTTIDIALAKRKSRVETLRFKFFYKIYKKLFQILTGRKINFGNFMAMKPLALTRLVSMQELSIHVAGTVIASKLRNSTIAIDRGPRYAGQSKMNFVGLALHGFKALMIFAEDVLVRVGIACAVIATLSVLSASLAIFLKLLGYASPGWFSVALGILVLIFLQTGALSLMTLMLTGVVRGGAATNNVLYTEFVEQILESSKNLETEKD